MFCLYYFFRTTHFQSTKDRINAQQNVTERNRHDVGITLCAALATVHIIL